MLSTGNYSDRPFHIMAKPAGPLCNLQCRYCFYLEKENLFPGKTDFRMNDEVLESFIRQQIAAQPGSHTAFAWQGGEPALLGIDFYRKAAALQKKYVGSKIIENTFQTNGTLLNDEWCSFFKEHNFLVGLSIDGPEEFHNHYRITKGGRGSFSKVMEGLECLKKHGVDFNTLTVVQKHNSQKPLEVYHFLKEIGSGFMQFIPIVERTSVTKTQDGLHLVPPDSKEEAKVTEWSVRPKQYGVFLSSIFNEWVRNDVGRYYVQIFDIALEAWYGMNPSLCIFRRTCGDAMALEHNGDLYSCDHYVYPENRLGNILKAKLISLAHSGQQEKFGQDKLNLLPEYCRSCSVRFVCNGECPKHRFSQTPDGKDGLNYLCEGYKHFFNHIDPYMKYMANELRHERPPANVMQRVKEKDKGFPSYKAGPNDPCPCGSGRKYKKCCGR